MTWHWIEQIMFMQNGIVRQSRLGINEKLQFFATSGGDMFSKMSWRSLFYLSSNMILKSIEKIYPFLRKRSCKQQTIIIRHHWIFTTFCSNSGLIIMVKGQKLGTERPEHECLIAVLDKISARRNYNKCSQQARLFCLRERAGWQSFSTISQMRNISGFLFCRCSLLFALPNLQNSHTKYYQLIFARKTRHNKFRSCCFG